MSEVDNPHYEKSDFDIVSDIPLSKIRKQPKYPFADMDVGESFYAPVKSTSLSGAASRYAKEQDNDIKFATRQEGDGARVWRTA